ncbi:hypothetical protein [Halorussus lipolyticus]|uniref:hypothetical protein n=1 Tax=Halorussus lipolyticus TaxID=3034024 RepID=UPI0023E79C9C|nr:hypothetical protein [Halorussus sp. DT80]
MGSILPYIPVPGSAELLLIPLFFVFLWVSIGIHLYRRAKNEGRSHPIKWGLLGLVSGILGLVLYNSYESSESSQEETKRSDF